jgi:hypothetical protein
MPGSCCDRIVEVILCRSSRQAGCGVSRRNTLRGETCHPKDGATCLWTTSGHTPSPCHQSAGHDYHTIPLIIQKIICTSSAKIQEM